MNCIISLDWQRDAAGYELLPAIPHRAGESLLGGSARPQRIIPRGGQLIGYKPLEADRLYARFAGLCAPDEVLAFINKFGPLTDAGADPARGEDVSAVLDHSSAFRDFLDAGRIGERALARGVGTEGQRIGQLDLVLAQDPASGDLCMRLKPPTLLAGLWLQLGQKVSGARPFRECRYCRTWFETGPGADRRLDALFCTDSHRVLFNSRKRSKERGDHA